MKKFKIIGLLSLIFMTVGCDSILDKGPLDTFTNDNFWISENNVQGYANAFYESFAGYGNSGGSGDYYFKTLSDDQAGSSFADWTHTSIPASDATKWNNRWKEIRRANILLEHVDGITSMNATAKSHWGGVARLMRAWTYYHLVRTYGDVPWVNKSLNITDAGYLYSERAKRDVVMDSVLNDLNYACDNIPNTTSRTTFSQDVAYAMKAEICLYEGTFRKYRLAADNQPEPDLSGSTKYLTAAKEACAAIMNKSNYSLNASYQGNYNSIDLSSNKEMIFYKAYKVDILMHSLIDYTSSSTQMSGMTKDAFDSYLFTDGKPLGLTSEDKNDAASIHFGTKTVAGKVVGDTVLSLHKVLAVRDARLSQTIDTALCYVSRGFTRFNTGISMTSSSGYGVAKFDNQSIDLQHRSQTAANYTHAPLFWLSEIYLEYAEACAELGTATQNDLDLSINKLKKRAGLPNLSVNVGFSDPANTIGVSNLVWEIRRERRCELMFDNNLRYWDLIRWHQLDKLDSSTNPNILIGADIVNDSYDTAVSRIGNYINASNGKTRVYDKKNYLYPIPSDQLSLNPKLGQNPGWN
ncbi:MAG: RagB/SusD family nutrient uptake outer membrane protein [Bacteroidaceae bacterium]|nr:RagB/SusD family nutrient uptake outer membrane protein [Bacteroidaceae bacterium]